MSNDIEQARTEIDAVDREMAALFERRMRAVASVAAYKSERGLAVYDAAREEQVLARNAAYVDEELRPYYLRFLEKGMEVSRQYQHRLLEGVRVAYSGVEGAFAWVAAQRSFPDATPVAYPDFAHAYQAVVDGACDCAVLPLENSDAGEVGQVMDLLFNGSLSVNRMVAVPVVQNLLGLPGATLEGVRTVASHAQALAQCADFIAERGLETVEAVNTAVAARELLEIGDMTRAAIASAETAELYGLEVLERRINADAGNTTRFAVVSRTAATGGGDCFMLMFTARNEPGSLAQAINVVGDHGFNMHSLHSRPMKSLAWQYYFYIEAVGDIDSPEGRAMMDELAAICERLKVVGSYNAAPEEDE